MTLKRIKNASNPRLRLAHHVTTAAFVLAVCAVGAAEVSAQRQDPQGPRNTQGAGRRAPARPIQLKTGLASCAGEDCLKIPLDLLGNPGGLLFGYVPTQETILSGSVCQCGVRFCDEHDEWPDVNPETDGWSPVKADQRPSVITWLREANEMVFIRWRVASQYWDSLPVSIATGGRIAPQKATDKVLRLFPNNEIVRCRP